MEITEQKIITDCQAGQMETFVYLYDRYVEKIYKFLYFRTFDQELAEDITSQTFLKAMNKINSFNGDKGTFQAWLYQIARNLLIDEYRKKKPIDNIDAHFDIASDINLENETQGIITNEALQKLLLTLPVEAQELITMRLWDEMPYAEIAEVTGKTEGALKMQFSRIIDQLKKHAHLLIFALLLTKFL